MKLAKISLFILLTFAVYYLLDNFWLHLSCCWLSLLLSVSIFKRILKLNFLLLIFLMHRWLANAWIWIHVIQKTMILVRDVNIKKKPLKILYNSVSLENFLPFSIRFIFSHFKGLFVKGSIIVFQEVLLSVTFISRLLQYDFFF